MLQPVTMLEVSAAMLKALAMMLKSIGNDALSAAGCPPSWASRVSDALYGIISLFECSHFIDFCYFSDVGK